MVSFYPKSGIALQVTERLQKTPLTLAKVEIPQELGPEEILIKVIAAAQNPADSKILDWDLLEFLPATLGFDVAGDIVAVGNAVASLKVGDRVSAFLSRLTARHGGFQQYAIGQSPQAFKIPSYITYEEASTFPAGFATAVGGLFGDLGISIPLTGANLPLKNNHLAPILVWGGSSSVGASAIQLTKLSGYTVVATASPSNFAYVKSLGADVVIDYHDGDKAVAEIIEATGGKLSLVYDAISEHGSTALSVRAIGPSGGKITTVLPVNDSVKNRRTDIEILGSGAGIMFTKDLLAAYRLIVEALDQKVFIPNPVEIIPGGLLGVDEGFKRQREHNISAVKLVYQVLETPGIKPE